MVCKRIIAKTALCAAIAMGLQGPSTAAPREPVIVTPLSNPDPGLVSAPEPQLKVTPLRGGDDGDLAVEEAMQSFGRAIAAAALAERQAIEARCRSNQAGASPADRFAWAASCEYSRH